LGSVAPMAHTKTSQSVIKCDMLYFDGLDNFSNVSPDLLTII